ncbi:capsular exopolysaccharide synthesis family protein [Novosphingobium sp. SG720]|nr:capsular exopolysaccharide synthesis family protein [Novosphingobium sp. SG720]
MIGGTVHNNPSFAPAGSAAPRAMSDAFADLAEYDDEGSKIDVRKILLVIRANLWLIGLIIAGSLALALVFTMLKTPRYTAVATVQINNQSAQVLGDDQQDASQGEVASPQDTDRFLKTQIAILNSRAIAERVAQRLRLTGNPQFYAGMGVPAPKPTASPQQVREYTLNLLSNNELADMTPASRLATITFTSIDQQLSARIANAWANEFIQANLQRRYDSSAYARDFISGQLAEAKAKLEQSERDLNAYARQVGLIRTRDAAPTPGDADSGGTTGSVTTASLLQINTALNQAQVNRMAAEQRWKALSGGNLLGAPEVLANSTITSLLADRSRAEAELQRERARHLDDFPSVVQVKAQIVGINQQINSVAQSIRTSVKEQYDATVEAENNLKQQLSQLKGTSLEEQDKSVQYNLLAREADTNRSLYDGLLQRFKELNAAAGISASNISIIDAAEPPSIPSSPVLVNNMLIALLAALAISALVVLIRFQLDDAVRVPEDIEEKLGMPLLGVIPKAEDTTPAAALADPKSAVSESYNSLRGSLLYSTATGLPRSLLVTSSQPSEGKSTTSLAVATGLARLGKKVLLLDVDMRRPALHAVIGVTNEHGMSSLLTAQDTLADVVRETDEPNLQVITSGPLPPSPTELLSSGRLTQLLRELNEIYDVVILDSPPVLGLADAPLMSAIVDGVMLVVQSDRSRRGSLRASLRRLRAMHPNVLGAVLTMFDASKSGNRYSEYYGYNYYRYTPENEA